MALTSILSAVFGNTTKEDTDYLLVVAGTVRAIFWLGGIYVATRLRHLLPQTSLMLAVGYALAAYTAIIYVIANAGADVTYGAINLTMAVATPASAALIVVGNALMVAYLGRGSWRRSS